jgi:hypothetical protein
MGINVYVRLSGQTPPEVWEHPSHTGLSSMGIGCMIREAYHGEPYVTRFLFREAFVTGEASIPAATLRERLPEALRLAEHRERVVYHETSPAEIRFVTGNYVAFVEFCERLERATGEPSMIVASY